MSDLITFLRARLDDEERIAQAANTGGRWRYSGGDSVGAWTVYDEHWSIASMTVYDTEAYDYRTRMPAVVSPAYIDPDAIGRHMARHDPARVLAEVDAKRRMIDVVLAHAAWADSEKGCCHSAEGIAEGSCEDIDPSELPGLQLLALPHADHPDYRQEWRP